MGNLVIYFLTFMVYSFIGWLIEITSVAFETKRVVNRGFLIGPYCPIYGVGSLLMTFLLQNHTDDIFGLFVKAMLICSVLEYVTSYIMEKMFKTRWWDYSDKKFNINGRICLETIIPFGFGGVIIMKITNPLLFGVYNYIPMEGLVPIALILFMIFVTDLVLSLNIINSFKKNVMAIRKDSTEEISKRVREVLESKSYLTERILKAFPYINKK